MNNNPIRSLADAIHLLRQFRSDLKYYQMTVYAGGCCCIHSEILKRQFVRYMENSIAKILECLRHTPHVWRVVIMNIGVGIIDSFVRWDSGLDWFAVECNIALNESFERHVMEAAAGCKV